MSFYDHLLELVNRPKWFSLLMRVVIDTMYNTWPPAFMSYQKWKIVDRLKHLCQITTDQPVPVPSKPVQSTGIQTETVYKQTCSAESKHPTPPRPTAARSTPSAKSTPAGVFKDTSQQKKDPVPMKRQSTSRKDSLRSSHQRTKVRFTGKPCYLVKSFDDNNLVLSFCSKCCDNSMGVLRGLKTDKGGGMQLNTKHGTNFVWMCDNCEEEDRCSALDIQRQ